MLETVIKWIGRSKRDAKISLQPTSSDEASSLSLAGMLEGSRRLLALSAIGGLFAGVGIAALVTLITKSFDQDLVRSADFALRYLGICIFVIAAGTCSEILIVRLAQNNLFDLRLRLSRHILSAPFRELQSIGPHRIIATMTDDVGNVAALIEALPPLLIEAATLLGALVYMGWLSWPLLVVFLVFLLFGGLGAAILQNRSYQWHQRARRTTDALFNHFRALTDGGKELNMNARRRTAFMFDLSVTADAIKLQLCNGRILTVLSDYWGKLAFFCLIGLIAFVTPRFDEASRHTATSCVFVVLFTMRPISVLLNTLPLFGKATVALRNIEGLGLAVGREPHLKGEVELRPIAERPGLLELAHVRHRHRSEWGESGFLLGPIDLRIEPGELVFVTGGNGSGKTTLALLLLGLYSPDEGELRLDGEMVTDFNRDHYRQHFAAVFSDAFIFDALLCDNEAAISKRADELLTQLHLRGKVQINNGRFSTIDLSRGQRKRLALLAAYLEDRPFYVFDEWAAEQDPLFRNIFYNELLPELKARGKTVIVITHDDAYFHLADRRIHLNLGQIEDIHRTRQAIS